MLNYKLFWSVLPIITIFIPTGFVTYGLHLAGKKDPETDGELKGLLDSENLYFNHVAWFCGPQLDDWQSDRCTDEVREKNSYIQGRFYFASTPMLQGFSEPRSNISFTHRPDDPLYRALYQILSWDNGDSMRGLVSFGKDGDIPSVGSNEGDLRRMLNVLDKVIMSFGGGEMGDWRYAVVE